MAKAEITVTQAWQQIATGEVVITILERSKEGGALYINETAADLAAYRSSPNPEVQILQTQAITTFIRADNDGWRVIVDGVL